jgi:hypothetical protein
MHLANRSSHQPPDLEPVSAFAFTRLMSSCCHQS